MQSYGVLTGPAIGTLLRDLVRRAMHEIRRQYEIFEIIEKQGYEGEADILTSADRMAQEIYVKLIGEYFPGFGIIAEEDNLNITCTLPNMNAYITIDPLDGTRAWTRDQPYGVASMVALVIDGEIVCVWIGDVNTLDVYGYRPDSPKVHRISGKNGVKNLVNVERTLPLHRTKALIREEHYKFAPVIQRLLEVDGPFKGYETASGSIGLSSMRFCSDVTLGAHISIGRTHTPWDETPFTGMYQRLGIARVLAGPDGRLVRVEHEVLTEVTQQPLNAIYIPEQYVDELFAAVGQ